MRPVTHVEKRLILLYHACEKLIMRIPTYLLDPCCVSIPVQVFITTIHMVQLVGN